MPIYSAVIGINLFARVPLIFYVILDICNMKCKLTLPSVPCGPTANKLYSAIF